MPAAYGCAGYAGAQPQGGCRPASALAREAGAVVLGKTVTTEFAGPRATPDPATHGMAPTRRAAPPPASAAGGGGRIGAAWLWHPGPRGSVIRPGSYCGPPSAYKPSFGMITRAGVKTLSDSLDTVGLFARRGRGCSLVRRRADKANFA